MLDGVDRQSVAAIAALDDDVRRALFVCVRDAGHPVTRESAARTVGISAKLAAFHLDKLVTAGLLQARIQAVGARRVGRAPKVYEPSGQDVGVTVPQREYGLLAELLVAAVQGVAGNTTPSDDALDAARGRGVDEGTAAREQLRPGRLGVERARSLIEEILGARGFEPARDGSEVRLRNCPFHPVAAEAPELVCALNHAYLDGLLHGLGADAALEAVLAPAPGACCVRLRPR